MDIVMQKNQWYSCVTGSQKDTDYPTVVAVSTEEPTKMIGIITGIPSYPGRYPLPPKSLPLKGEIITLTEEEAYSLMESNPFGKQNKVDRELYDRAIVKIKKEFEDGKKENQQN